MTKKNKLTCQKRFLSNFGRSKIKFLTGFLIVNWHFNPLFLVKKWHFSLFFNIKRLKYQSKTIIKLNWQTISMSDKLPQEISL